MTGSVGITSDTVLFVGGDTSGGRAFYALAMDHGRGSDGPGQRISFVSAGDVPVPPQGCWVPCFGTDDHVAAGRRALDLGARPAGTVPVDGRDQPVYSAPDGALFGLTDVPGSRPHSQRLGDVAFVDLYTPLAEEAATYYAQTLSCHLIDEPAPSRATTAYWCLRIDPWPVLWTCWTSCLLPFRHTGSRSYGSSIWKRRSHA